MDKRYIQLYSLHEEAEKDFEGTLKRVADMGYTGVEFANFYGGLSASDLKKLMKNLSLEPLGSHITTDEVEANLDYASDVGFKHIIDPWASLYKQEDALAYCEKLNKAGKLCKDRGMVFSYHNHAHEFIKGKDGYLLETMLANTDPALVSFQLDVGWVVRAGVDASALLAKYPGRFKMIHVKECSVAANPEVDLEDKSWNVATGKGLINWQEICTAVAKSGAEAFIVEREFTYKDDRLKCVEEDCAFLKNIKLP